MCKQINREMYQTNQGNNDQFRSIVDNYEALVKELNQELFELKTDHQDVKAQLLAVIAENQDLSRQCENVIRSSKCHLQENEDHDLTENLKQQINTLNTEKECVTKLWQEAVKAIDALEDELKIFQAGHENFVSKKELQKLKTFNETQVAELQTKLAETEKKLEETMQQTKNKIRVKHCEMDQSLDNQASALKIIKNLEAEVLSVQKRLQEAAGEKLKLERHLANKEEVIQGLKTANQECLNRVSEAIGIVEAALNEKDAALFRESRIQEENEKLVKETTEIVQESQEKIQRETDRIKLEFGQKQKSLLDKLEQAQKESRNQSAEIEALNKKRILLESELERIHRGHCSNEESDINKLLVLEKNLESTFQKLLLSEKQNIQLASEKEVMRNDLDQMANIYERNLKSKEIEISTWQSKATRLEGELTDSYKQVNKITEKMAKVNERITRTEQDFKEQKDIFEKGLNRSLEAKLENLTKKYNDNIMELQRQVEKKNEINEKWRTESKIITENLEKMAAHLKREAQALKKSNKQLKQDLKKSEEKVKHYKTFLDLISKDVAKISHLTVGNSSS
ncbi:hypothetical protein HUJ04_009090 [Dendroctonus ponderosae]|nr:hypothetical protein HUJ04_009090 [Dendroctonus ponderosae]